MKLLLITSFSFLSLASTAALATTYDRPTFRNGEAVQDTRTGRILEMDCYIDPNGRQSCTAR